VISSTLGMYIDEDDGTAYVRYNTRDPPLRHVMESLTADWSKSSGQYSTIYIKNDYPWYEGGGHFKRDGLFYAMIGTDCCFCQWGADALVFTATNPVGNWTLAQVNETNYCADGHAPATHYASGFQNPCSLTDVLAVNYTIPAQQFGVVSLRTSKGPSFLYYGERFRSSPDGIKARDFQAWIPLEFDGNGNIQKMQWLDQFQLDL